MPDPVYLEYSETYVTVVSPYWLVRHVRRQGLVIDSIVIKNASGKNLLTGPMEAVIDAWSESNAVDAALTVQQEDDGIVLTVSGRLADASGQPGPFQFVHRYWYGLYIHSHSLTVTPLTPVKIHRFSAVMLPLDMRLNSYTFGTADFAKAKPRYAHILGVHYDDLVGRIGSVTGICASDPVRPWQVAVFQAGVEGLQWCGDSAEYSWNTCLGCKDQGCYQLERTDRKIWLEISPLRTKEAVLFHEPVALSWYTILPNVPLMGQRKWLEAAVASNPFPSDRQVARWADKGVQLLTLHNDTDPQQFSHDYWHDGQYPPYKPEKMKELGRFIRSCHRQRIKVIPYFSGWELSPDTPAFFQHHLDWYAPARPNGNIRYTPSPQCGVYGALMCPDSGWGRYLSDYIQRCVTDLDFDGYYLDWSSPTPCYNLKHRPGQHNGTDGLVKMLTEHRRWLGTSGIIRIHSGGQLRWLLHDNIADHLVTFEEGIKGQSGMPDNLEDWPPTIAYMNACDTGLVPCALYQAASDQQPAARLHQAMPRCALMNALPYPYAATEVRDFGYPDNQAALDDPKGIYAWYERLKPYDLATYRFFSAMSRTVKTDQAKTGAALYAKPGHGLLLVANLDCQPVDHLSVILDQAVAERFTLPSVHRAGPLGPLETVLIEIPQADSSDC